MKMTRRLLFVFLSLCLSSFARAQAGVTLLVKTDMSCNWKLDGQPMGQLMPDGPKVVLVSRGEHLIEAAATVGAATSRNKVQVDRLEKTVEIQLKGQNGQPTKMQRGEAPRAPADVDAETKETWTDPSTGLMWTRKDNGSNVDWVQATAYCSKLKMAGYDGWRLPTNEELQGIRDLSVKVRKTFDDGVTYDVYVKGNLNITGRNWTSSEGEGRSMPYQTAWLFTFAGEPPYGSRAPNPFLNFIHFSYDTRALCVRSSEE